MAARRARAAVTDDRDWVEDFADGGKLETSLDAEVLDSMHSFIDYTLTDRALPYVDGLKPVHRAILWCMWKSGLRSGSTYVKSARPVGDTMGKYHPHGDQSIYLTLAGMARAGGDDTKCGACKLNLSLVDGHGNFGASFEDGPAASRYTEARLSKSGEACVRDVGDGAVFMAPTFDAQDVIPELLPVRLPLLLINGSDGLAYGYNVCWIPHNPKEAIRACILRLDKPSCTEAEVRRIMPGPDFPSGGIVVDREEGGIADAYGTGFGAVTLTSRYRIEAIGRGRHHIDFYETPFGVARGGGKAGASKTAPSIILGITKFAEEHPECGITDVKNLSDKDNDCLIEVTVKSGIDPEAVARALVAPSARTRLTETMSYRQSAVIGHFAESDVPDAARNEGVMRLVDSKPTDITTVGYIDAFIEFRCACVRNESNSELRKNRSQRHLIDGMLKALLDIDEVIATIRKSKDKDTAKSNLKRKFKLDDVQADYILAIPLSRLTRSDRIQLEGNSKRLAARAEELEGLLSSEDNVRAEVRRQLEEQLERQVLGRRTTIVSPSGKVVARASWESKDDAAASVSTGMAAVGSAVAAPAGESDKAASVKGRAADPVASLKVNGSCCVMRSSDGKVWQASKPSAKQPFIQALRDLPLGDTVMLVFDDGSSLRLPAYELPSSPSVVGRKCMGIVGMGDGSGRKAPERVCISLASGKVKVLGTATLTKAAECPAARLDAGDSVSWACAEEPGENFVIITSNAQLLRFPSEKVRAQGRTGGGVDGIKLAAGAKVLCATAVVPERAIVMTGVLANGKATPLTEFPPKGRATGGVRCQRFLKGETALDAAWCAEGLVALDRNDRDIRVEEGKRDASGKGMQSRILGWRVS